MLVEVSLRLVEGDRRQRPGIELRQLRKAAARAGAGGRASGHA
jgi:hypothetical protein